MNKIKSLKTLSLAVLIAMGLTLTGCDLLGGGDDDDRVDIMNFDLSTSSVDVSDGPDTITVLGEIDASEDISSVNVTVTDSATGDVAADIDVKTESSMTGSKNADLAIKLVVKPATLTGHYTVEVTASTANGNTTESASFYVTGSTRTPVVETQVILGAQDVAQGSALDLDNYTVYTTSQVVGNEAKVDLYVGFSELGNVLRIMSPEEAATDDFAPQNWPAGTANATRFYKTSLTSAEFDAIGTQEEIDAMWNASDALSPAQLNIYGGEVIIAETYQGTIRLIHVENVSAQNKSAVVTIIGYQ